MKNFFLLLILSILLSPLTAQQAEKILLKTQNAYRALDNYFDNGSFVMTFYGQESSGRYASYLLAMDKEGNIAHWFVQENGPAGAAYSISVKDSIGQYTRLGNDQSPIYSSPSEAAARLGITGGGVLYLLGSLFYTNFNSNPAKDSSMLLYYDSAELLSDTTINADLCFVVNTNKTIYITPEMADLINFRYDSSNHLLELPIEQRGGARSVPGPKFSGYKYFIRKSDYILLRCEHYSFTDDGKTVQTQRTTIMDPKYNVDDLSKYLNR